MVYVAVETIMSGAGIIHTYSNNENEVDKYVRNHPMNLHTEELTEEQYQMVVDNGGYIEPDWF